MEFEFKFKVIESGNLYLIPRFVRCPICTHEIPIGEILDNIPGDVDLDRDITDFGGCGKSFRLYRVGRYFGMIKNISNLE